MRGSTMSGRRTDPSDSYGTGIENDVPSGYGSQYDDLFAANPYRNQTYKMSWWERLLQKFGFRTGYDAFRENALLQANEYDAGIYSIMEQDAYNNEVAKAQRMRAAGLNPDLLGTGDVSDAATPAEDPNGMPPASAPSSAEMFSNVSKTIMDIIPSALSFATGLQQMKGIRIENDAKELQFGQGALEAASEFFLNGISEQDYKDAFEKQDFDNLLDASMANAKYLAETFFSSKKARSRFNLAYGMHSRSLLAKMAKYKTFDEFEKNRKSLLTQRASHFFSDDDESMMQLIESVMGPLEDWQKKVNEFNLAMQNLRDPNLEQGLKNKQMSNQLAYENTIDPVAQSEAENSANRRTQQEQEILKATDDLFSSIMTNLSKHDNWWSKIAMALIGIARAQVLSGMHMQFGRNTQYQVDGDTGVYTESGRSTFNISN